MDIRFIEKGGFLSIDLKEKIIKDLENNLPNHQIRNYFKTKECLISSNHYISYALKNNECIGLIVVSEENIGISHSCYIETLLISESHHRSIVSYKLLRSVFNGITLLKKNFPDIISMKTYNPITYLMLKSFCSHNLENFYPNINRKTNKKNKEIAFSILKKMGMEILLNKENGVVRGGSVGIGGDFWKTLPKCKNSEVNTFFKTQMSSNDRLLCFIHAPDSKDKKAIMKKLRF